MSNGKPADRPVLIHDGDYSIVSRYQKPQPYRFERNELIQRLLADECEMCGSTVDVQVHHVRALRDLNVKGQGEKPLWI